MSSLSWIEREELARRLSVEYAEAIKAQAIAQERVRGLRSLARTKLGDSGFHEIESKLEIAEL